MRLSPNDRAVVVQLLESWREANRELDNPRLLTITRRTLTKRIERAKTEITDLCGTIEPAKLAALLKETPETQQ